MQHLSRSEAKARGLKTYFTGKPCPSGHVSERIVSGSGCAECGRVRSRARMATDAAKAAKKTDRYKAQQAEYSRKPETRARRRQLYAEGGREESARYRAANTEKAREYARAYYRENKCALIAAASARLELPGAAEKRKEYIRGWAAEYRKTAEGKLAQAMRRMLSRCLTNKRDRTIALLGYTADQLRARLESQFATGMSWENYGEWHIDHIKPIAEFNKSGIECPATINALDNLQPLWAFDNLSKGSKYSVHEQSL